MRKVATALSIALVAAGIALVGNVRPANAVTTLAIYSPEGEWNPLSKSWLVNSSEFSLQVMGARSPSKVKKIDQLWLIAAVPKEYWNAAAEYSLTLRSEPSASGTEKETNRLAAQEVLLTEADMLYGTPDALLNPFPTGTKPWEGVYPAQYWAIRLDAVFQHADGTPAYLDVENAGETVYGVVPGDTGSLAGDIQYYTLAWDAGSSKALLHLDLVGYPNNGSATWRFAPNAVEVLAHSPEPGTLVLLVSGMAAVGARALRRRRRQ